MNERNYKQTALLDGLPNREGSWSQETESPSHLDSGKGFALRGFNTVHPRIGSQIIEFLTLYPG
jgi:hypothetical protein